MSSMCTEFGGFRCSPGAAHLQCNGCGGMIPARPNTDIEQKCLGCDRAFCGAYWYSQGVNSSHCNLICNQETFRMISQHHISGLPDRVHGGNPYEDITERCIQQSGKTLQAVISEWIAKFDNKEIDRSRLQLNNADTITSAIATTSALIFCCTGSFCQRPEIFFRLMLLTGIVAGVVSRAVPSTIDPTMPRS